MYINDLNSAYEYERERRNDERHAAAESQRARGIGSKPRIVMPAIITGSAVLLIMLLGVF